VYLADLGKLPGDIGTIPRDKGATNGVADAGTTAGVRVRDMGLITGLTGVTGVESGGRIRVRHVDKIAGSIIGVRVKDRGTVNGVTGTVIGVTWTTPGVTGVMGTMPGVTGIMGMMPGVTGIMGTMPGVRVESAGTVNRVRGMGRYWVTWGPSRGSLGSLQCALVGRSSPWTLRDSLVLCWLCALHQSAQCVCMYMCWYMYLNLTVFVT
jgi:hypothetical protein